MYVARSLYCKQTVFNYLPRYLVPVCGSGGQLVVPLPTYGEGVELVELGVAFHEVITMRNYEPTWEESIVCFLESSIPSSTSSS